MSGTNKSKKTKQGLFIFVFLPLVSGEVHSDGLTVHYFVVMNPGGSAKVLAPFYSTADVKHRIVLNSSVFHTFNNVWLQGSKIP